MEPLGLFTGFALGVIALRLDQARIGRAGKEATRLTTVESELAALERAVTEQGADLTKHGERNARLVDSRLDLLEEIGIKEHEKWEQRFRVLERELSNQIKDIKTALGLELGNRIALEQSTEAAIAQVNQRLEEMQNFIVQAVEEAQARKLPTAVPAALEVDEMMKLMASLPAQQEEFTRRRAAQQRAAGTEFRPAPGATL